MITVYAQKDFGGVQIWRDAERTRPFCRFSRHNHAKMPDRRNKRITLNCFQWKLEWIN